MNPYDVIRERVFSERTTAMQDQFNKYAFRVSPRANKIQIAQAVEIAFKVKVVGVNTMWVRGKRRSYGQRTGTTAAWKKAIVTVAEGQQIQLS